MIPTDSEFLVLYLLYGMLFFFILFRLFSNSTKQNWLHFILFISYTALMIYTFSNEENFRGGGSLVILFYGFILPIAHIIVLLIIRVFRIIKKKWRIK